jgi:DNA-binding HxlR family transcriptional regulator
LATNRGRPHRLRVTLNFPAYPVQASLGALGRKWAFLVLMNIAFGRAQRFNELLRSTPGMSKRILALRLRELERGGFIARAEQRRGFTRWQLADKGADVVPVLLTLLHFGAKWSPRGVPGEGGPSPWGSTFQVTVGRGNLKVAADPAKSSSTD